MEQEISALEPTADQDWAKLLDAVRQGDAEALGEACEHLRGYLLQVAEEGMNSRLRSKFGASDIVQRTFLDVQRDLVQFSGSTETEFRAWLVKLTQHNLRDAIRLFHGTQRRDAMRERSIDAGERQLQVRSPDRTPSSLIRRRETDEELARALIRLSARSRKVVAFRHQHQMSFAAIGKELGLTESHARKAWSRALEELREILNVEQSGRPR